MVRLTFTDDARLPKVITFGGAPLVKWFAYLRDNDASRLYLRREVDNVIDPEVMIVEANAPIAPATDSRGVTWFDFHVDPNDATKALLYFIADGTLYRIEVTSTPIGEEPTTQQFDRTNNRFENYSTPWTASVPFEGFNRKTNVPVPEIVLVQTVNAAINQLIITVPPADDELFEPDLLELYQLPEGGNGTLFLSTTVPFSRQLILNVAANAVSFTTWAVRSVRLRPNLKSQFSRVIDDGNFDTVVQDPVWAASVPFEGFIRKQNRQPIKESLTESDVETPWKSSTPFEGFIRKLDRQPIKTSIEETPTTLPWKSSVPFEGFIRKS